MPGIKKKIIILAIQNACCREEKKSINSKLYIICSPSVQVPGIKKKNTVCYMSKAAFNARNDTYDKHAYCIDSFIEVTEILYRTEQLIREA